MDRKGQFGALLQMDGLTKVLLCTFQALLVMYQAQPFPVQSCSNMYVYTLSLSALLGTHNLDFTFMGGKKTF